MTASANVDFIDSFGEVQVPRWIGHSPRKSPRTPLGRLQKLGLHPRTTTTSLISEVRLATSNGSNWPIAAYYQNSLGGFKRLL
jgi:hypothetical protein